MPPRTQGWGGEGAPVAGTSSGEGGGGSGTPVKGEGPRRERQGPWRQGGQRGAFSKSPALAPLTCTVTLYLWALTVPLPPPLFSFPLPLCSVFSLVLLSLFPPLEHCPHLPPVSSPFHRLSLFLIPSCEDPQWEPHHEGTDSPGGDTSLGFRLVLLIQQACILHLPGARYQWHKLEPPGESESHDVKGEGYVE